MTSVFSFLLAKMPRHIWCSSLPPWSSAWASIWLFLRMLGQIWESWMLPDSLSLPFIRTNEAAQTQAVLLRTEAFPLRHDCEFNFIRMVRGSTWNVFWVNIKCQASSSGFYVCYAIMSVHCNTLVVPHLRGKKSSLWELPQFSEARPWVLLQPPTPT